jgi:hypothetical protein
MQKNVILVPPPPPYMCFFEPPQGLLLVLILKMTLGPLEVHQKQMVILKPHLFQDTSFPHLVSLFPTPLIPTLLVGRGVTTQAPSNNNNINNNTNNKRNPKSPKLRKIYHFQL